MTHHDPPAVLPQAVLPKAALTIAGSDSCGGAGIQADLKTFTRLGVFGASVVTAVTAQNTLGVRGVTLIPPDQVSAQLDAVLRDLPVRAVKTGMLGNAHIIRAVAQGLDARPGLQRVVDPVMVATSGARLLADKAITVLIAALLPGAALVTPNLPEAQLLAAAPGENDPERLAQPLLDTGCRWVLIKGGHAQGEMVEDWLFGADRQVVFRHPRITGRAHGTGCCLSAAVTAGLARGLEMENAVATAIDWLQVLLRGARKPLAGELLLLPFESAPPPGRHDQF